jgi:hypothetical protein
MKKFMIFVAVLTMVAFAFGAMAQQKTTTTPAKPAPAKPAPAPKIEKFSGAIAKVDGPTKSFDVKKKDKVMTFATDAKTKITKGKEVKAFADLKVGMDVTVEYTVEMGKNIASAVKIATPKAAPKPAAPKPAPKK